MTEKTRSIIKKYQDMLPHAKEKIAMAGLMLVIALIVSSVATYAWLSLSRAPEVKSITTTLSSNGSLEIGLAGTKGEEPEEFDVDESVKFNTDVMVTNRLWGNIINLSDERYGFSELVLRPAQLNASNIARNPLKGVEYGEDGRVEILSTDFIYSAYNGTQFLYSKDKGVRAISSYTEEVTDATEQKRKALGQIVETKQAAVNTKYMTEIPARLSALSDMISTFAQEKVNGTDYNPGNAGGVPKYFEKAHLQSAKGLYDSLLGCMELQKEAYIALANYQLFTQYGDEYEEITSFDEFYNNPTKYNVDTSTGVSRDGIICLQGLTTFVNDYKVICDDREHFRIYIEDEWQNNYYSFNTGGHGPKVENASNSALNCPEKKCEHPTLTSQYSYRINYMISRLIDYSNMYLVYNGKNYRVTELQSLGMGLLDLKDNTYPCYIVGGILKRFEQSAIQENSRLPKQANTNTKASIKIAMKVKRIITINFSVNGETHTTAEGDSYFNSNFVAAQNMDIQDKDYIAVDTYGMAIDFWVRSNAEKTNLTLAGAVTTDEQGNIVSYDGINRVWGSTGDATLTTNSTTQGGGSCYIYYADSPEDMNSSLLLLRSMKVAFVRTSTGEVLATAGMDTDHYYSVNGRITVPLIVEDRGITYTYLDETNAEVTAKAITDLVIDEAKDITAIVYLDGATLENKNVLAAEDIEGQLNIQFGSSEQLKTVGDKDLLAAERYVTATASKTLLDYDNAMTAADLTTTLTAQVEGTDPNTIEGFFLRAINASQGQREEKMTFTKQANGEWTVDYKFKTPGNYYLRYLRLDGVDYALPEPVNVTVAGFVINSVTWNEADPKEHTVFSVDSGYKETVSVTYATSDESKMPKKVSATFERQDGENRGATVTTELSYKSGKWTGVANFQTSGEYILKFLVQDGKYVDLASANNGQNDFTKKLNLTLGLTVAVYDNDGTLNEQYDPEEPVGTYYKEVWVRIFDNSDNMITPPLYDDFGNLIEGVYIPEDVVLVLKYAPGTVDTDLVWDESEYFNAKSGCYKGTLQITKAGRYVFNSLNLGTNVLSRSTEAPTYIIVPPDAPTYLPEVTSDYSGSVQFAPLTNDAYIGPIGLKYAESASVGATVKNSVTGEYYYCDQANAAGTPGTIYYDSDSKWYISLPTYTLDLDSDGKPLANATYTQEGTWTLESIEVWDCYDTSSNFVESTKPLFFAEALPKNKEATLVKTTLTPHTTDVSCSINVAYVPGTVDIGDTSSTPFMTIHNFSETGAYVALTDDAGRTIPKDKVSSSGIKLGISYNSNDTTSGSYGYVVTGINRTDDITFKFDEASGHWIVDPASSILMRYVGPYKVDSLVVNFIRGKVFTLNAGEGNVPTAYNVRSKGPDASSGINVLTGNTEDKFNGSFLQSYTPDSWAKVSLVYTDENGTVQEETHVKMDYDVKIKYTYSGSKPSGFNWSSSNYSAITLTMTKNQDNGIYYSPSTPFLPGTYKQVITVNGTDYTTNLKDLKVTATVPTLKVNSVSPSGKFNMNAVDNSNEELVLMYSSAKLMQVQNYNTEYTARVFIKAEEGENGVVKYTLPKVKLTLSGIGGGVVSNSKVYVNNAENSTYNKTYQFTSNGQTVESEIGGIKSEDRTVKSGCDGNITLTVNFKYEAGTQTISQVTATDTNGATYVINLSHNVTITETYEAPPSITFQPAEGYTTPSGKESTDGEAFTFTLPTSIGTQNDTRSEETGNTSADWSTITPTETSQNLCYLVENTPKDETRTENCNEVTYYWQEYSVHKYQRITRTYRKTTTTTTYNTVKGVVKWNVGGELYDPGETITVSGAVTAKPVIGIISETQAGSPQVTTLVHTTQIDIDQGVQNNMKTSEFKGSAGVNSALNAISPPSGYSWFVSSDKNSHDDIHTTEYQIRDDYTE